MAPNYCVTPKPSDPEFSTASTNVINQYEKIRS
jgi:hypothetical protein